LVTLHLQIVEGPEAGRLVRLTESLVIGRHPEAGLRLDDEYVSELHVRITPAGDGAIVEDLGDPGGTFVNDAEVAAPTRAGPGDEIQIGVTVFELRTASDVESRRTAVRAKPPPLAAAPKPPDYTLPELAAEDPGLEEVESLLDVHTKEKARTAPLAMFVLVVFAVLIFLATSKL
jgi:S-DNA-T family DNA segregation ATPase FtsK/SpoIIIE